MPDADSLAGSPVGAEEFAALMARLGPFGPGPRVAVGVSGGADSLALALLAGRWGADVTALICDHGLRSGSATEAAATARRLDRLGIATAILTLDLPHGPALAARARAARLAALRAACAARGIVNLLLGHHQGDQAETLMIRALAGSRAGGLAGMAAIAESHGCRLLRPLLGVAPARLRATLLAAGVGWIEDPSNADPASLRARLRAGLAAADAAALAAAATLAGHARAAREAQAAAVLAALVSFRPEGFALLDPGPIDPACLAAALAAIAGAPYRPPPDAVAALAAAPRPATLAGVRLLAAGRLGPGWLLVREPRAIGPGLPAVPGTVWDGRFRVRAAPPGLTIAALGAGAAGFRRTSALPACVLRPLPALWRGGDLVAVPHLGYHRADTDAGAWLVFEPPRPAAGAAFFPG